MAGRIPGTIGLTSGWQDCIINEKNRRFTASVNTMKASDLFVKALEAEGVEFIFAIPGEENLGPARVASQFEHSRHSHTARAGGGLHSRYVRPPHRQDRGVHVHPWTRGDEFRNRGGVRPAGWHAAAADHGAEAHQVEQTGPLPDRGRG